MVMPVYLIPVSAGVKRQLMKVEAPTVFYPLQKYYHVTYRVLQFNLNDGTKWGAKKF
jgi:hypothetical protein